VAGRQALRQRAAAAAAAAAAGRAAGTWKGVFFVLSWKLKPDIAEQAPLSPPLS
jgi:hypothetical protein